MARRSFDASSLADEALIDALSAPDRISRDAASQEIARRVPRDASFCEALAVALDSRDRDTRRRVATLLGQRDSPCGVTALTRALSDHDSEVRAGAARALGRQRARDPQVWLSLIGASADSDMRVRIVSLAALAVISPAPAVLRPLGFALVTDRYSVARSAHDVLAGADAATLDAARTLLDEHDPLAQRAGLAVMQATGIALDRVADSLLRLVRPGVDSFVRRAATRALGRVEHPSRGMIDRVAELGRDWDPALRVIAAVALGQFATRDDQGAARAFATAVRRVPNEEVAEMSSALRAAGAPIPPAGPLLDRLAVVRGYAQLDFADALLEPFRATESLTFSLGGLRLDDAIEQVADRDRPRLAAEFLAYTRRDAPVVRASCAVFAAHLDPSLATTIVLQHLADLDEEHAVRAVARALIERVVTVRRD